MSSCSHSLYTLLKSSGIALSFAGLLLSCDFGEDEELGNGENFVTKTVEITKLSEASFFPLASAPGRIVSLNDTTMSSQLQASVASIDYHRGENVPAGTTIIHLDCRLYDYRLQTAKGQLDIARSSYAIGQSDYKRHQELLKQELISTEMHDLKKNGLKTAEGNLAIARSNWLIAKRDVGNCEIRAPFDATVMDIHVAVGEFLQPGTPILRILDIDNIEIWSDIAPLYAEDFSVGDQASFKNNEKTVAIRLTSKSAVPDLLSGNYKTRFTIEESRNKISGSGQVLWESRQPFLAEKFLQKRGGKFGIFTAKLEPNYTAESGRNIYLAQFIPIQQAQEGWLVPVDGMDDQINVVTKGMEKISNGDLLEQPPEEPPEAPEALSESGASE